MSVVDQKRPVPSRQPNSNHVHKPGRGIDSTHAAFGVKASIQALLDVLLREGISKGSIHELRDQVDRGDFVEVVQRSREYAECLFACRRGEIRRNEDGKSTQQHLQHEEHEQHEGWSSQVDQLLLVAWSSLCRYLDVQYKKAYRTQRYSDAGLAEQLCTAQRGLIQTQQSMRRRVSSFHQ